MRITKNILFRPITTEEVNMCHCLKIPFITSSVFGGFPVFIGDLDQEKKYMEILKGEKKKRGIND